MVRRYVFFLVGLFVNSQGIALITRANPGTSPISSNPYVLSIGFTPSLGMFTLYFSLLLIVLQLIVLGERFPKPYWLQVPVSMVEYELRSAFYSDLCRYTMSTSCTPPS